MKENSKISSVLPLKVLALITVSIAAVGMVLCAFCVSYLLSCRAYDGVSSYEQTDNCEKRLQFDAYEAVLNIKDLPHPDPDIYREENSNQSLLIMEGEYGPVLYNNFTDREPAVSGTIYVYRSGSAWYYSTNTDGIDTAYTVEYGLKSELTANDSYRFRSSLYSRLYEYRIALPVLAALLGLLFIIDLVFLFSGAGRREGEPGIHLSWLDKIPLDLYAGICAVIIMLFVGIVSIWPIENILDLGNIITNTDGYSELLTKTIDIVILLVPTGYVILSFLLTFAARIKAGKWYRNTVIGLLAILIINFAKMVPSVVRVLLIYTIFWLLFIFFWAGYYPRMIHLFMIVLGGLTVIWIAYQCSQLKKAGSALAEGDMDYEIDDRFMTGPFKEHAENLHSVRNGVQIAVEQQMKSERLKTELITNVSHDIKTPLTSIVNYVDLLQKKHTPEEEEMYLDVLARNSARLKKLTEDLVEASKASTGNISVELVPINIREMIDQSVAEYADKLDAGKLRVIVNVEDPSLAVLADGRLLWRVFGNLLSNCVKYAQAGTRIYLDAFRIPDGKVRIIMKNTSRDQLNVSSDELMQRFVRGDQSRTTEGSGLGLNIAKSLVELQHGTFDLLIDGDLFKAIIELPEAVHEEEVFTNTEENSKA